jgi:hypothetical protein
MLLSPHRWGDDLSAFQTFKLSLVGTLGLPKDALHIYVGLILFLGTAALFRRPLRSPLPILVVILAALAGELWDIIDTRAAGRDIVWARNWHDVWNTSFWPMALYLLARFTRVLKR